MRLSCADATVVKLEEAPFDAVLTDPPYFGNVQYAELMDFCYVWLRRLAGKNEPAFARKSTRNQNELTGNISMGRTLEHFADGLSKSFQQAANLLRRGAPFVFTYHHNCLESYFPVAVAILDAHLVCSQSLPCPAEMGASIHINGTGSSILDTVFVCRSTRRYPRKWMVDSVIGVTDLLKDAFRPDSGTARSDPTPGDMRCIA